MATSRSNGGAGGGGFVRAHLPSPPPSSVASSAAAAGAGGLPRPRRTPLKPGSARETTFIMGVDGRIARITRRFAMRRGGGVGGGTGGPPTEEGDTSHAGYSGFAEAARDIELVADLVWLSGTPSLQIPYLLGLALLALECLPAFSPPAPSPPAAFRLLRKLDHAFASLVRGRDCDTDEPLPGFPACRVTATEKVRIRSLVERTRVVVVEVMDAGEFARGEGGSTAAGGDASDDDDDLEGPSSTEDGVDVDMDPEEMDFGMEMARVYDKTLVELGLSMDGRHFEDS